MASWGADSRPVALCEIDSRPDWLFSNQEPQSLDPPSPQITWSECSSPEQAFGKRRGDKQYPVGTELAFVELKQRLRPVELHAIYLLLSNVIYQAAELEQSWVEGVLVVGSALLRSHNDLDLLCCTEPAENRSRVAQQASSIISQMCLLPKDIRDHTPTSRIGVLTPEKFFCHSGSSVDSAVLDVSFVGSDSGTFMDVVTFHQRANLPYSVVPADLTLITNPSEISSFELDIWQSY